MPLGAGSLNSRLTLWTIEYVNTDGNRRADLQRYKCCWANDVPLSGSESETNRTVTSSVQHTFTVKYDGNINKKMVCSLSDGKFLSISAVKNDNRKFETMIDASEIEDSEFNPLVTCKLDTLPEKFSFPMGKNCRLGM